MCNHSHNSAWSCQQRRRLHCSVSCQVECCSITLAQPSVVRKISSPPRAKTVDPVSKHQLSRTVLPDRVPACFLKRFRHHYQLERSVNIPDIHHSRAVFSCKANNTSLRIGGRTRYKGHEKEHIAGALTSACQCLHGVTSSPKRIDISLNAVFVLGNFERPLLISIFTVDIGLLGHPPNQPPTRCESSKLRLPEAYIHRPATATSRL